MGYDESVHSHGRNRQAVLTELTEKMPYENDTSPS